jgi:hypothetical protein
MEDEDVIVEAPARGILNQREFLFLVRSIQNLETTQETENNRQ